MSRSYHRSPADWDLEDIVRMAKQSVARRQARRLSELAWGDAAKADQVIMDSLVRAPQASKSSFLQCK